MLAGAANEPFSPSGRCDEGVTRRCSPRSQRQLGPVSLQKGPVSFAQSYSYVFDKCLCNIPHLFKPIIDELIYAQPAIATGNHGASLMEIILRMEPDHLRLAEYIEALCARTEG